jgi:hypothetical protein
MADRIEAGSEALDPQEVAATGWPDGGDLKLKSLWADGYPAREIARAMGGIDRDAVMQRARELGLPPRSLGPEDEGPDPADPILAVQGHSVRLKQLDQWVWPSTKVRYLAKDMRNALRAAAEIPGPEEVIDLRLLLEGVLAVGAGKPTKSTRLAAEALRAEGFSTRNPALPGAATKSVTKQRAVVAWDVVEVLTAAAALRHRMKKRPSELQLAHVIWGIGHTAGEPHRQDLPRGLESSRATAVAVLGRMAASSDDADALKDAAAELARRAPPPGRTRTNADFSTDAASAGQDVFGASEDAAALADLILLRKAEPPLAIGVFGPWGSGKSTLLAELRSKISRSTGPDAGARSIAADPQVQRVSQVLQLEFNAWTFADSENLWASLTSELFDQIAAGGFDRRSARTGSRLVSEVAARTAKEVAALRSSAGEVLQHERAIADARRDKELAEREEHAVLAHAALETARELLGTAGKDGKADAAKGKSEKQDGGGRTALEVVRTGIIGKGDEDAEARLRRYAEAGGAMLRWCYAATDFIRGGASRWAKLAGIISVLATVAVVALFVVELPAASAFWTKIVAWTIMGIGYVATIGTVVLPAWRVVAMYGAKLQERRDAGQNRLRDAERRLRESQAAHDKAAEAQRDSEAFIARYGELAGGGAARPGLMLDYLLKESVDVAAVRNKLGLLGTVRRCFDQLDHVVRSTLDSGNSEAVERIIIYIDDLDRCSERQVVQVLEAIHLLLAFPCFVVVAAVDAQWLRVSLERQHHQLGKSEGPTVSDYLEKIFQVPFWIKPIRGGGHGASLDPGFSAYVRALVGQQGAPDAGAAAASGDAVDIGRPAGVSSLPFSPMEPRAPSAIERATRERLRLVDVEVALLERLGPLAAKSPRAVKRMINTYRLIRVRIPHEELAGFLTPAGGTTVPSFATLLFALACEVGLPRAAADLVAHALPELKTDQWDALLVEASKAMPLPAPPQLGEDPLIAALRELDALAPLLAGLRELQSVVPMQIQHQLARAFELVGRYSFRLSGGAQKN